MSQQQQLQHELLASKAAAFDIINQKEQQLNAVGQQAQAMQQVLLEVAELLDVEQADIVKPGHIAAKVHALKEASSASSEDKA